MNKSEILNILSDAGWYEGRKIDFSYFNDDLSRELFSFPNKYISDLFEEFWNIKVKYYSPSGIYYDINFNVASAIRLTDYVDGIKIEKIIGEKILPVATALQETFLLWISYGNKFYLTDDKFLYYIGDDFFNVIEFLLSGVEPVPMIKYNYDY